MLAVIACNPVPALAHEEAHDTMLAQMDIDITQLSIEDLLNLKITSLSKKTESATRVPAAVYVLTAEDIRRSGVTSIPEALRLVPGMDVARVDANKWAVSSRGFNSRSANKLLVMVDGRTIYDFLFSGVLWETKDVMLENVDRIEVIRGPGGAVWGANAVNGVINIITKPAAETQGGLVEAAVGTEERAFGAVRYGFKTGDTGYMRVFATGWNRDEGFLETGEPDDDARLGQAGFRYDSNLTSQDILTVQGEAYDGRQGTPDEAIAPDSTSNGGDLLGRWSRNLPGGGRTSLQFYYDATEFDNPVLNETRHTVDLEFNHELPRLGAHDLIYGLTYRRTSDEIGNTPQLSLIPDRRTDRLQGAFVQDEIELSANRLYLTLGSKFEDNDYTGSEVQPNIRLAWHTSETDTLWAAVSRAVRTPSRLEEDFVIPLPGTGQELRSNHMQEAEQLTAYEIGYRFSATPDLFLDLATFYNVYDDLITVEGLDGIGNKSGGETHGMEIAATWIPAQDWKFAGGYTFLDMDLELDADSLDNQASITALEGNDPENQAFVRMGTNFAQRYQLDVTLRYADRLQSQNVSSYTVADIRFAGHINENLELSLVGQNLFEDHHLEQGAVSNGGLVSEVEAGVYAKLLWIF
ncbi:MAG TPA: TonB-dependent receptor [Gammaproteobacteria bacterium]|nr:TonB-dependent receptor [Gammaproteobacteria bacterium]